MIKAYAVLAPDSVYNSCRLVEKGDCINPKKGEWTGVNTSTEKMTGGRVNRVFLHSIFRHPHTSCSCFQNVAWHITEVDGIAIMHRKYVGPSPGAMTWIQLANMVVGRQYPKGAAAMGTAYLRSPKFLQADGGYERIVWLTSQLKSSASNAIPEHLRSSIATEKYAYRARKSNGRR